MKVVYPRCAGLDVHKKGVHVCVRIRPTGSNKIRTEFAQFATFYEDVERLHEFLRIAIPIADALARWLAPQYALAAREELAGLNGAQGLKALRTFVHDCSLLRRGDLECARTHDMEVRSGAGEPAACASVAGPEDRSAGL